MARTVVPDAYTALLALSQTAVAPVQVIDGDLGTRVEGQYVQLARVEQRKAWAGMGAGGHSPQREAFDVVCAIWVYDGDDKDGAQTRAAAYALLDQVEDALAGNPTLGVPAVTSAMVTVANLLRQGPTDIGGRGVALEFHVTIDAYLTR